jgi:2-dehydro-3-deoxyglucarate aldolase/4-hydroxy-2-oxoheptanedioate aldolase
MELKRMLDGGRPLGTWLSLPSPGAAELLAGEGFDFVVVDTEHTPSTTETVESILRAIDAAPGDTEGLVRLAWNDHVQVKRVLDTGPTGVMAPRIDGADAARDLVRAVRYPPQGAETDADGYRGRRGVGGGRAADYGRRLGDRVANANDDLAALAQIESPEGVDSAAEIAAVPGIDALFVGPADLSANLGAFRDYGTPDFEAAIAETLAAGDDAGIPVGTLALDAEGVDRWLDAGFDFVVAGTAAGFLSSGAERLRERYESRVE